MRVNSNIIYRLINHRRILPTAQYRRVLPASSPKRFALANFWGSPYGRHPSIFISAFITALLIPAPVSAITYQDSVDVSFTFDPTLSISLSSSNISIDSLSPGNYARSNTVAINVSTNNVYGYTLTAKVGDDGGASGTSASSNLVNASTSTSFTSLSTNDNLTLSSFSPNTWGYTTARSINNSMTTYSGLLYNTDTILNMTTSNAGKSIAGYPGTNTTNFTIGASAATDQLAGDYTNIISFTVVTNNPSITINDLTYMQDFATLTSTDKSTVIDYMEADRQYTLIDNRDNNTYTIAKLCMNKTNNTCTEYAVWMTQNLDLCIGCTGTAALTSLNTDLNQYDTNGDGTGTTFTGYTTNTINNQTVFTWTPTAPTMTGNPAVISGTTVTGNNNNNAHITPRMTEGSDIYSVQGTRYNSLVLCEDNGTRTKTECMHYHVGNYYNWTAAVAMSNTSSYATDMTVMPNSICPRGWSLPNGINSNNGVRTQSDFNALLTTYNMTSGADTTGGVSVAKSDWNTVGYVNIGKSPLFFTRSGLISGALLYYFGTYGYYWSSTVNSSINAYVLNYNATSLYPAHRNSRDGGRSVRCMLR